MTRKSKNVEEGKDHILRWVIEKHGEEVEIAESEIIHPKECMEYEESHDADGKLAWAAQWPSCGLAFHIEGGMDDFEDFMYEKGEGVHEQRFSYRYHYYPPCYPDYEPDYDFDWKSE